MTANPAHEGLTDAAAQMSTQAAVSDAMQRMFDAEVRTEVVIWIPGIGSDAYPDAFSEEFYDNMPERPDAPLWTQLPVLAKFAPKDDDDGDYAQPEDIAEALHYARTPGFLIQAATPVRHYNGTGGVYASGWGHYRTEWLYAASEADIAEVCLAWAQAWAAKEEADAGVVREAAT